MQAFQGTRERFWSPCGRLGFFGRWPRGWRNRRRWRPRWVTSPPGPSRFAWHFLENRSRVFQGMRSRLPWPVFTGSRLPAASSELGLLHLSASRADQCSPGPGQHGGDVPLTARLGAADLDQDPYLLHHVWGMELLGPGLGPHWCSPVSVTRWCPPPPSRGSGRRPPAGPPFCKQNPSCSRSASP